MFHHLARLLRKNMTEPERGLWRKLRGKQFAGFRFRRQAPVGQYIADFACFAPRVIVELDGSQHAEQIGLDAERTRWFESQGFLVLRYWNHQVSEDAEVIEHELYAALTRTEGGKTS